MSRYTKSNFVDTLINGWHRNMDGDRSVVREAMLRLDDVSSKSASLTVGNPITRARGDRRFCVVSQYIFQYYLKVSKLLSPH